jgi:hypothetical protein
MHDNHTVAHESASPVRQVHTGETSQASEGTAREPRGDESAGVLLNN